MRIIIITQGISRILTPLINNQNHKIIGIIEASYHDQFNNNINFKQFTQDFLSNLFYNKPFLLENFAIKHKMPYFFMHQLNQKETIRWLKAMQPDVIVVYSMSYLLSPQIYLIPKYGTINLHPSLLPLYRGPNPIFWQYFDQQKTGGATVHFINEKEDNGNIICKQQFPIKKGLKWHQFLDLAIKDIGVKLILEALQKIEKKELKTIPQPTDSPNPRSARITTAEYKHLLLKNNWDSLSLWHFLCGTEPWLNDLLYNKKFTWQYFSVKNFKEITNSTEYFYDNKTLFFKNTQIFLVKKFKLTIY